MGHHASMCRRAAVALALLATATTAPISKAAATGDPEPAVSPLSQQPADPFRDRLLGPTPRKLDRASSSATGTRYRLPGGPSVEVRTSFYSGTEIQGVINSLAGLLYGKEMNRLSVYVATPSEIATICSAGMAACYSPSRDEMVISGVDDPEAAYPRSFVIAHEYGHHIANHSDNGPWTALDQGTKRWATYERVCEGIRGRLLYPGNEGEHYWENPGEAFAQSYATLIHPELLDLPWGYSPLLFPDGGSFARIAADVTRPPAARRTIVWRGRLGKRGAAVRRIPTPFDGGIRARMAGPRKANYNLFAINADGRVLRRGSGRGSRERLRYMACGERVVRIAVRSRRGSGPFKVKVTRP